MPDIQDAARRAAADLAQIKEQPFLELQSLSEAFEVSKGVLPPAALKDALKALNLAQERLLEGRMRDYGSALAKALRPHGLLIECRVARRSPAKRRKAGDGGGGEKAKGEPAPAPSATSERPGWRQAQ